MGGKRSAASIWDWCLAVLPITAVITYLVTLLSCNLVTHSLSSQGHLLAISDLSSGSAYIYFIVGFALLLPQILLIIIGRLQFLLQTQNLINHIVLYIFHIVILIPFLFMLIVSFVSGGSRSDAHIQSIYGILGSIALYCLLHTIAIFYLYIRRASGSQYVQIGLPIYFVVCSLLLIGSFIAWIQTKGIIVGYIAATIPFLYFLGFVPQFWTRARSRARYSIAAKANKMLDSLNG